VGDLVSIIVPIYRIEDYLETCIESLIKQSCNNLEIILVNDGSDDSCPQICDKYKSMDSRIKVVHQKNQGLIAARKSGFKRATGKYVTFVDGDDWVLNNHIEKLVSSMNGSDLCITSFQKEFLGKRFKVNNFFSDGIYEKEKLTNFVFPEAISTNSFFAHGISTYYWNKLFLRNKLEPILMQAKDDIVMGEDSCLVYPYLYECNKISIISNSSYIYRQRQDSIIKNPKSTLKELKALSSMFVTLKNGLADKLSSHKIKNQIHDYFLYTTFTRLGGIINVDDRSSNLLFTNSDVPFVLVSSGSFGQIIFSKLKDKLKINVAGWLDHDSKESQISGLDVKPFEYIKKLSFNKIIIASFDAKYIDIVKQEIKKFSDIADSKFITYDRSHVIKFGNLLSSLGLNLETYEIN